MARRSEGGTQARRKPGGNSFAAGLITGALGTLLLGAQKRDQQEAQSKPAQDSDAKARTSPQDSRIGAGATSPSDIPTQGWWAVLKRAFVGFSSDRIMANAAAVTFYTLLALFPGIAALISIYGLFADPAQLNSQVEALNGVIPGGGVDIVKSQVQALTSHGQTALTSGAAIGFVTSLWSANAGVKAVFDALNAVYHEQEKRGFIKLTLITLGFTVGLIAFMLLAMLLVIGAPILLKYMGLGIITDLLIRVGRWVVLLIMVDVLLAFLYRFGPSRNRARWRWVSWGSTVATVLWIAASVLFSYYVANFGSYNKTYGSLGAIVGFMTWIWISSMVVLMGAEINAELEQQTERDTTEGPERPMGARGAYKADVKS